MVLLFCFVFFSVHFNIAGQSSKLTFKQQLEDFTIFKGGLKEGHSGLYYYIEQSKLEKICDSIQNTFKDGDRIENYYLKLRFIISSLKHGHTRVSLPSNGNINYKMAVLDSTKKYLPFEFIIVNNNLIIKQDCSKEQLIPNFSIVKSINNINSRDLINKMLPFIPADGINQTFKYYSLYNYFQFHYLFNLFYPDKNGIKIELFNNKTHYYIELQTPKTIDSIYFANNKRGISEYDKQLEYKANLSNQYVYLKIGSFYKGLIENFGQKYESFLDSAFNDIKNKKIQNLVLDLRNNEGGGDGYDNILLSYLKGKMVKEKTVIKVPSRDFKYKNYTIDLTNDIKNFIDNPSEFLRNDSSLYIKGKYVEMMTEGIINSPIAEYDGNIFVLINGGSFSATNAVISQLYMLRNNSNRKVLFIGEENGGDIYSNSGCAGQGYIIMLPNSSIRIDMPFLCFGELKKEYPKKRLPDFEIYDKVTDLKARKDKALEFAIKLTQLK